MKKVTSYLIVLLVFSFSMFINVNATYYEKGALIPVNSVASVSTDLFSYYDFVFNTTTDSKGNSTITFDSISNNTDKKVPVSINLLMFDENQKNIGFVTYCSSKDISSDYSGVKLGKGESRSFTITVNKKYFAVDENEEPLYSISDVKYVSVLDENKYCQIGGYSKYVGLSPNEIMGGEVVTTPSKSTNFWDDFDFSKFSTINFKDIIFNVILWLVVFIVIGAFLNALYKRMSAKASIMSYLPVTNVYIAVLLAFGNTIGLVYFIVYIISVILAFNGVKFLCYILTFGAFIAFCIDIVKLITKNYNLLSLSSNKYNSRFDNNNVVTSDYTVSSSDNTFINNDLTKDNTDTSSNDNNIAGSNTFITGGDASNVIDLSYNDKVDDLFSTYNTDNSSQQTPQDNLFNLPGDNNINNDISSSNSFDNNINNSINNNIDNNINNNSNSGESDLSKFFK
jgi:hypothetical protein